MYSFWPTENGRIVHQWTIENYARFFTEQAYWRMLLRSFWLVALASAFTVLMSFPFAYFVAAKVRPSQRLIWILFAIIPFWTSYLIRVLAWLNMFGDEGLINKALTGIGLVHEPIGVFGFGRTAIVITFVYLLFPLSFLATLHRDRADQPGDVGCRRRPRCTAVDKVGHDNPANRSLRHRCRFRLRLHRNDGRLCDAAADSAAPTAPFMRT
jgi:hypothetical protein